MSSPIMYLVLPTDFYASEKDVESVADKLPRLGSKVGWDLRF